MFWWLVVLTSIFCCAESGRILGVFHTHGRSHFALGETLMKGLAARGHQVTMISPYPQRIPLQNYTDVFIDGVQDIFLKDRHKLIPSKTLLGHGLNIFEMCLKEGIHLMEHKKFQEFLKSGQTFDLVIADNCANYFHLGIAHHYGASSVVVSSIGMNIVSGKVSNNPFWPSYVPNIILPYDDQMTFFQRVFNTWYTIICYFLEEFVLIPQSENLLKKYFPKAPSLDTLFNNVSLVLANSHIAVETARPQLPNIKLIGGLHINEPKKLPKDIQQFLDDAQNGAILFSLGSNLRMSDLPPEKLDVLIQVFSKLPQRILWKWKNYNITKRIDNIMFKSWFPQNDVLAHPNIKALITHGGINTIIEATYRGIPMLGIPFFADQFNNLAAAVKMGQALNINLQDLTHETLSYALHQLINNPKYGLEAKRRSAMIRDEEIKPLDRAIYWVEHVLRHGDAKILRSGIDHLNIFSYLLIDVAVFSLGMFVAFIFIGWYLIKWVIQMLNTNRSSKTKTC